MIIIRTHCKIPFKLLQNLFLFFLLTSVFGWLYEVFLEVVVYRWGFSNRGVLLGPYCVVYGTGAVVLLGALTPLLHRRIAVGRLNITPAVVFCGIVLITTLIELVASYIMEWAHGGWLWDYTRFSPNFQGRIALNPSLRFGLGGMFFLYVLYPAHQKLLAITPPQLLNKITLLLLIVFALDCLMYLI